MLRKILVPTDGSHAALEAARVVGNLAEGAGNLHATVVVVIAPYTQTDTDFDPAYVEQRNRLMRQNAQEALKKTADLLTCKGLICMTKIIEGDPVSAALAHEARAGGYDLIAMSSRGMGKQKDSLHYLGSVTEHLIRRCDLPVLVVPVPEEDD